MLAYSISDSEYVREKELVDLFIAKDREFPMENDHLITSMITLVKSEKLSSPTILYQNCHLEIY